MQWEAVNGYLVISNGIPIMKSTEVSSLNIQFKDGFDFLDFVNRFVKPVAEKYGFIVNIEKKKSKREVLHKVT